MRRKRLQAPESGGVNLGLIITPMLDMAFQILSFFIMTYHPSALEGHIDGKLLPPSTIATANKENKTPSDDLAVDKEPPLNDVVLVQVKSVPRGMTDRERTDGQPSQIFVKKAEDTAPTLICDTDVSLDDAMRKLGTALKKIHAAPGENASQIKLEGDGDLKHLYLMRAYDVCKEAGFRNVNFVAPAPEHFK